MNESQAGLSPCTRHTGVEMGEADELRLMFHDRHSKYIPRKSLLGILTSSSLMSVATDKKNKKYIDKKKKIELGFLQQSWS